MNFEEFCQTEARWWREHLLRINAFHRAGQIRSLSPGNTILFPSVLLLTDCGEYFVSELLGASKDFSGKLTIKHHRTRTIYGYINSFDDSIPNKAMFFLQPGIHAGLSGLCLAPNLDYAAAVSRFPVISTFQSRLQGTDAISGVFNFSPEFKSIPLHDCLLVNHSEGLYRIKSISELCIYASDITDIELKQHREKLSQRTSRLAGLLSAADESERSLIIASQLQSLFLTNNLRETTIGEFIRQNPEIVRRAFDTQTFVYEPSLPWLQHDGSVEDEAINPDLLVQRPDGFYDIVDLKTALLGKKRLTVSERKRRRFNSEVSDGVSQLANYKEYFNYPLNAKFALEKYGVVVRDPKLMLVVGSFENANKDEISQAKRMLAKEIEIIDYDTLCSLFLSNARFQ